MKDQKDTAAFVLLQNGGSFYLRYGVWGTLWLFVLACSTTTFLSPEPDYICEYISEKIVIDGHLTEGIWQYADMLFLRKDIRNEKTSPDPTSVQMCWDDKHLYIAAYIIDKHLWTTLAQNELPLYQQDVFEVFLDPFCDEEDYTELEINAQGAIWDLRLDHPYHQGGVPNTAWAIKGLNKKHLLKGTLNDPSDRDEGWILEMAIPWRSILRSKKNFRKMLQNMCLTANFMQVDWHLEAKKGTYSKKLDSTTGKEQLPDLWVWKPSGLLDIHRPNTWGRIHLKN